MVNLRAKSIKVKVMAHDYRKINREVMTDTMNQCITNSDLRCMISDSLEVQRIIHHCTDIEVGVGDDSLTTYEVNGGRTFGEAQKLVAEGYSVAVLNFANSRSIGGAPYSAGAQEESLCRCSTLLPCLEALKWDFYDYHKYLFEIGKIGYMGNDDIIYTPNVCVFKKEEHTDPIIPKIMPREEWFHVNVITCAAPQLMSMCSTPTDYEEQISRRIKRILDVAVNHNAEAIVLGAWGCGAFGNPEHVVARLFMQRLKQCGFKKVVFALGRRDYENSAFYEEVSLRMQERVNNHRNQDEVEAMIVSLLRSTGRENIDKTVGFMRDNKFFEAPASVSYHNNFVGGLAFHSLMVCAEALKLNIDEELPVNSVIITSLLHDICKADQYHVAENGIPKRVESNFKKGHGRRSMFIVKRGCQLPLTYDEEAAIWWHMGEYEVSKEEFRDAYRDAQNIRLCKLIQQADAADAQSNATYEQKLERAKEIIEGYLKI